VEPNDHVRIVLTNQLPAGTDIHFHGISTPFSQDGVAPITQPMVMPGETYTYEFYAPAHAELGMYHPHNHGQVAVVNGMFGVFQVGDIDLPRGKTIDGVTVPSNMQVAQEVPMVLNDAGTIGLSLNGKAFPATDPVVTKVGQWTLVHYYNEGLLAHPMHLHHIPQLVVAKDGFPLEQPYFADTINIAPGERYSVLVQSRPEDVNVDATDRTTVLGPGIWAFHCHILTHSEGDKGLQGMVTAWVVAP
jgi:FtsP/CotA-like multicopper oxidase with cupredoxin domain